MVTNNPPFEVSTAPYPGLRPFRGVEADIFFGREKQTDQLLQRLSVHRFLAVTGPSGCGKSSLVKAGMIPALNAGFMAAAGARWRVCKMRPGERPMARLAQSLAQPCVLGPDRSGPESLPFVEAALRRGPLGLAEVVGECEALREANLLVVVDQCEELFRYREQSDRNEAEAFVELLLCSALRTDLPIYVVITMRSDYLGDCALFQGLPEAINDGQYLTPRLTREECRSAIVGPAKVFGGSIDEALVNRLLNDFGPDPDQLPLLQHALMRMWTLASSRAGTGDQAGPRMTDTDYEAVGGLSRALSSHADEAMAELDPEQQRIAQVMFRRLTERLSGKRDTRAPAQLADVAAVAGVDPAAVMAVVDVFRRSGRCFIAESGGEVLDISHESLIRQWETLAQWVEREAESAAMYRRLRETARLWRQHKAGLWREPDLGHAVDWRDREKPSDAWASRYGGAANFSVAMDFLRSSERDAQRVRQWRRLRRRALALALALFATAPVVYLLVQHVWYERSSVSYYSNYVKAWGVPQGVGKPLTLDEVRHRGASFELTRRGSRGPVVQMRVVDGSFQPTTGHETGNYFEYNEGRSVQEIPVRWEFGRDAKFVQDEREVATYETAYNKHGKMIWIFLYLPSANPCSERNGIYLAPDGLPRPGHRYVVHISYTKEGYEKQVRYRNRLGNPVTGKDQAFGAEYAYNEAGARTENFSLGPDGKRMNDEIGNSGVRTIVDARGNATELVSYDAKGQETIVDKGWSRAHYTYDAYGRDTSVTFFGPGGKKVAASNGNHRITWSYDGRGLLKRVEYWDEAGRLAPSLEDGCYARAYEYDPRGQITRQTCEGPGGRPVPDKNGVVSNAYQYDERGSLIEWSVHDAGGNPARGKDGYCRIKYEYSEDRLIRESYFDAAGSPTPAAEGYARVDRVYDQRGNGIAISYHDVDGEPFVLAEGYSSIAREFEEGGEVSQLVYLGPDGKPVLSSDGSAGWRAKYDAQGNLTKLSLLGLDRRPTIGREGYAVRRYDYDPLGRCVRVTNYGERNQIVLDADGVAGWRSTPDELGREIETEYFGVDERPVPIRLGYVSVFRKYDEKGNVVFREFRDAGGHPVALRQDSKNQDAPHGYARVTYAYTPQGHLREEAYFDTEGHPILVGDGYARVVHAHDERGNVVEAEYYGADRNKAVIGRGYHRVRRTYDARGNPVEFQYFGTDGQRVNGVEGYSRVTKQFDQYGRHIESRAFDKDDKRATLPSGAHRTVLKYDPRGRHSDSSSFGLSEQPIAVDGCYSTHSMFDVRGHEVEDTCLGNDGELALRESTGCAVLAQEVDAAGRTLVMTCLGVKRKPVGNRQGIARATFHYYPSGGMIRAAFSPGGVMIRADLFSPDGTPIGTVGGSTAVSSGPLTRTR